MLWGQEAQRKGLWFVLEQSSGLYSEIGVFGSSFSLSSAEDHPSWAVALLPCLAGLLQPQLLGKEVLSLLRLGKHPLSLEQWGWAVALNLPTFPVLSRPSLPLAW